MNTCYPSKADFVIASGPAENDVVVKKEIREEDQKLIQKLIHKNKLEQEIQRVLKSFTDEVGQSLTYGKIGRVSSLMLAKLFISQSISYRKSC